jgi:YVTN family beta-propeller protein
MRRPVLLALLALLAALSLAACRSGEAPTADAAAAEVSPTAVGTPAPTAAPSPAAVSPTPTEPAGPVALGRFPERVYVPNSKAHTVTIIDPATREVIGHHHVDLVPHHVTPAWDLQSLVINNTSGNTVSIIDPYTGEIRETVPVEDPYNLYWTPDGSTAVVVAERLRRLDLRDPHTWELQGSIEGLPAGIDHGNFTRDGLFVASCEFSGMMVKVDLERREVVAEHEIGGKPVDVVRIPGQETMLVANETLDGVHVYDPLTMTEEKFLPTGDGTHGILLSREKDRVFVSNRLGGSISVIDLASLEVVDTWHVGGSPDMGQLNPAGTELWISNRYHGSVSVIDTTSGEVLATIPTGAGAHGLTYFPNVDAHSLGHNGVYVEE